MLREHIQVLIWHIIHLSFSESNFLFVFSIVVGGTLLERDYFFNLSNKRPLEILSTLSGLIDGGSLW